MSDMPFHAFCLSAPHSGGGKTTIALSLMRALRDRGLMVQGFKCGPDYIDPSFHQQATGRLSPNLDTWMMGREGVRAVWTRYASQANVGICEGAMGLFDSRSPGDMTGSTADCALALNIPVFLIVQTKGMAGSLAAVVAGFRDFHPQLRVAGVIANGVGSRRHAQLLAEAIQLEGLPPLVGAFPLKKEWNLPERQLGLVPAEEFDKQESWYEMMGKAAEEWLDLDKILALSQKSHPCPNSGNNLPSSPHVHSPRKRLGLARDEAFRFYYEENLDLLKNNGWELVEFSPLRDTKLPENLDMLYLGGGYPEVFARELSENTGMRTSVREFASAGKEIFAECGGYMYLGKTLITASGEEYPLCGVINGTSRMGNKLRSLGYREVTLEGTTQIWPDSLTRLRGHEFHWSDMELHEDYPPLYSYVDREGEKRTDGVCRDNVKAGYIHLYWAHIPEVLGKANAVSLRYSGRVLLLNGSSSAGKTSLAHAFQRLSPSPVMVFSVDLFLPICGSDSQSVAGAINDTQLPLIEAFHAGIAASARAGAFVIVDHVIGENPEWYRDLSTRLGSLPLKTVKVRCSKEVLISRESHRRDRRPDLIHALRQNESIHDGIPYDLEIDTSEISSESCAQALLNNLVQSHFFTPNSSSAQA